ncbi:hypothetical protein AVEN_274784-1 [Araneus ventricosus]|uniref:Uncharacterized protein n=1 Tax=Araneus ventricosus TaxID=182803 RepID=A0A4Y2J539_ARAVE|nr:hypothetical protein AVEN_274784-1 [Araneus ventricosus]
MTTAKNCAPQATLRSAMEGLCSKEQGKPSLRLSTNRLMDEHGAVYKVEFFMGDFSSNLVIMALVLNQSFGKFWDGCRDVDTFAEIPQQFLSLPKSFLPETVV